MRPLVLLRPEPGLSASAARARAVGLEVIEWPLFDVEPVEWAIPDCANHDALLLTSANGVRMAGSHLSQLSGLPVYAVGTATAAAATKAGFDVVKAGSEGIDALMAAIPASIRLIHLTGEHRRAPAKHRPVTAVIVYRSVATEAAPPRAIDGSVIAVHSPRAGERLAELVPQRGSTSIAAISDTAASAAGAGWASVDVAGQPNDAALLSLARELCQTLRP